MYEYFISYGFIKEEHGVPCLGMAEISREDEIDGYGDVQLIARKLKNTYGYSRVAIMNWKLIRESDADPEVEIDDLECTRKKCYSDFQKLNSLKNGSTHLP